MAQNRYLPYGYKIEKGKMAIEPQEAETIRKIYSQYAQGLSYQKIAEQLTESGARYMPDKPQWNKNMVARILQNQSYLGTEKHPAIIENSLCRAAKQMVRPYKHTESSDIKVLKTICFCGVCGTQVRRRLKTSGEERWYCPSDIKHIGIVLNDELLLSGVEKLQNYLVKNHHLIKIQRDTANQIDIGVVRAQSQIDLALTQPRADHAEIQQNIMALAAQKYGLLHDTHCDGKELKAKISQLSDTRLYSSLLKEITAQIRITHTSVTALVLKIGQTIALPTAEKGASHLE